MTISVDTAETRALGVHRLLCEVQLALKPFLEVTIQLTGSGRKIRNVVLFEENSILPLPERSESPGW